MREASSTVWINLISDFCSGWHENPNNLDCPNPKKVWQKGIQPKHACIKPEIVNSVGLNKSLALYAKIQISRKIA